MLANGPGWSVADVVCTCGRDDRPFEERHDQFAVAIVVAGSFQYRNSTGRALMTPGSFLLGSPGQDFECAHAHGEGDRCIAFWFTAEYIDGILSGAGADRPSATFQTPRLNAGRHTSDLTARAVAGALTSTLAPWDELASDVAGRSWLEARPQDTVRAPENTAIRISDAVRWVEDEPAAALSLDGLADAAGVSPFHFLRSFRSLTGTTPHQYIRRARLRRAAELLLSGHQRIIDVALDSGFNDVSHFTRSFQAEFGSSPRRFRANGGRAPFSSRSIRD